MQQFRRALDVGEQEGDRAGREIAVHLGMMRQAEVPVTGGRVCGTNSALLSGNDHVSRRRGPEQNVAAAGRRKAGPRLPLADGHPAARWHDARGTRQRVGLGRAVRPRHPDLTCRVQPTMTSWYLSSRCGIRRPRAATGDECASAPTAENSAYFGRRITLEPQRSGVSGPKPSALSAELRARGGDGTGLARGRFAAVWPQCH